MSKTEEKNKNILMSLRHYSYDINALQGTYSIPRKKDDSWKLKDNISSCYAQHIWLSISRGEESVNWTKGEKSSLFSITAEVWFPSQLESTEKQPI